MSKTKSQENSVSKYHVPNLTRALLIMELLAEHPQGLTSSQITSALKISRNSVFRITATLFENGYLTRDDETRVFQLSQKILTMGYAALSEESLVEKSLDVMREVRDQFKETVPLGILHGNEGLVIEEVQGLHSFRFVLEPGRCFSLHSAAPGKAIVAFLPKEKQDRVIRQIKFKKYNERTITDRKSYQSELEKIRRCGYAVDHAEEIEGMHCVSAPIFNRHGHPVAAIWLTGPSHRIKEKDFPHIGKELRRATDRISKSLGYYRSTVSAKKVRKTAINQKKKQTEFLD
jgi:DNA-binding IclR family transcriptional regulator